jgi:hypothetical protein
MATSEIREKFHTFVKIGVISWAFLGEGNYGDWTNTSEIYTLIQELPFGYLLILLSIEDKLQPERTNGPKKRKRFHGNIEISHWKQWNYRWNFTFKLGSNLYSVVLVDILCHMANDVFTYIIYV